MNTNTQTANISRFTESAGITSIVVIGAALVALGATIAAAAWHVAVPMVGMVSGIAAALA